MVVPGLFAGGVGVGEPVFADTVRIGNWRVAYNRYLRIYETRIDRLLLGQWQNTDRKFLQEFITGIGTISISGFVKTNPCSRVFRSICIRSRYCLLWLKLSGIDRYCWCILNNLINRTCSDFCISIVFKKTKFIWAKFFGCLHSVLSVRKFIDIGIRQIGAIGSIGFVKSNPAIFRFVDIRLRWLWFCFRVNTN